MRCWLQEKCRLLGIYYYGDAASFKKQLVHSIDII